MSFAWRQINHEAIKEWCSMYCRSCLGALYDFVETQMERNITKLHLRCIFIMDDSGEHLPEWFNSAKDVDSENLLLTISRTTLQRNKMLRMTKKNLVKMCRGMCPKKVLETWNP